ncbi:MAG TPA: single-stranded DNA-binding protein [Chitinophagales bacterium]|jgi:single-strand DNA-binding protein|nr:single-stranded DNA-binding protein [Chitinophagales bacterium]HPA36520.1 single-stranded DNA-binding protein [Chitinophagales bacterium]HQD13486.1 single-stranded DNA-binding protein [Chitinophagales bacterium]HQO30886.1 single-stranded DNA-binding protein [Chitinophagales bacterium]HQO88500.1 single-stranded DNA-binding protein [Chitinophagales bacterium]
MSVNKVILIGRLGKDPEVRKINPTTTVCNFPLATNESYKKEDGTYVEQTEWHNIVMWRGVAERAERILKKGNTIYVEGKLKTRSWEDKEGNKRYTTEIVVENFQLLEKREGSGAAPGGEHKSHESSGSDIMGDPDMSGTSDDLPF